MSILTVSNLTKFYGPDEIFSGVTAEIPHRARIALVGPNGAGKTTLLNILAGLDIPTEGSVTKAKGLRIGFLPQRPELMGDHVLWDEMLSAFAELREMEAELARLETALADPDQHDTAMERYGELQEKFEFAGGYTYEQRIRRVLHGLSFSPEDYHRPLAQLSGGQKTRALLGRLLLEEPDLLLLDEPTNHLDIDAIEWLENYLKEFTGAVLAVSHDRYFMDAVATTVWELDFGTLETYRGNYSHYVRQREERHERLLQEYEAQQEFIAKQEEYIRRNIAGQNTRQAKGRLRRLERLKRDELILRPRERRDMHLRMKATVRSGDLVLRTRNLTVGWDEPLFQAPDITLVRGEVAALIGPNGVGKSTFVKTIVEQIPPLSGEVKIGAAVKIGYFAQAHEMLNPKNSILDEVLSVKEMGLGEARNYLGLFLFSGDDVFRPVETLSGGERGRVALAKLALSGANFLVLDEPTNHLDISSQEVLQNVLSDFKGTILLVSHDRYLIDALATQIWAVNPGEMQVFNGTYQEYLTAREKQREADTAASSSKPAQNGGKTSEKKHGLNPYQLKQRLDEIEATIHTLEEQLQTLTADIETASAQGDAERVRELGEAYTQTEADLQAAMQDWERLVE
ncbi:MAG TPA: ABC-F family ATP-binding cassette domain-containing protein [Oceanobacillus sp.]|nr:ABC-F family ATP-binding cassette domain-containing protein [Oceanobacillus sp.]